MNRLVVIGFTGVKRAYLNLSKDEAMRRYASAESVEIQDLEKSEFTKEFAFEDEFGVYDAWEEPSDKRQ